MKPVIFAGHMRPLQTWMVHHPYTAYLACFVAIPLGLLGAVSLLSTSLMLPVLLLTGAI